LFDRPKRAVAPTEEEEEEEEELRIILPLSFVSTRTNSIYHVSCTIDLTVSCRLFSLSEFGIP
jgi:hypothetical protein